MVNPSTVSSYPNMRETAYAAEAAASGISVTLTVSPTSPAHGATVTAMYSVQGNSPGPGETVTVSGQVTIGGTEYQGSGSFTAPGAPALPEAFAVPTAAGLTFTATSNPAVFTAVVP